MRISVLFKSPILQVSTDTILVWEVGPHLLTARRTCESRLPIRTSPMLYVSTVCQKVRHATLLLGEGGTPGSPHSFYWHNGVGRVWVWKGHLITSAQCWKYSLGDLVCLDITTAGRGRRTSLPTDVDGTLGSALGLCWWGQGKCAMLLLLFSAISEQGSYYQKDFFLDRLLLSWSFGLKEQVFLGTFFFFFGCACGFFWVAASPAPNLGYKGGKTKNKKPRELTTLSFLKFQNP